MLSEGEFENQQSWDFFHRPKGKHVPMFSVIVPFYNDFNSLSKLITCLKAQTFDDFEVIIVDDLSIDRKSAFATFLESSDHKFPLSIIFMKEKANGSICRNVGCDAAKGEYIAFLDSDDVWLSEKLASVQQSIDGFDTLAVHYHKYKLFVNDNYVKDRPERSIADSESYEDYSIVHANHIQCSTLVLPRSFATDVRFDVTLPRHQDLTFIIELRRAGFPFLFIDQTLSEYRFESGKLSEKLNSGVITPDFFLAWRDKMLIQGSRSYGVYTFTVVARAFQLTGQYGKSLRYCLKALSVRSVPHIFLQAALFVRARLNWKGSAT